jgi:hypothetical protein
MTRSLRNAGKTKCEPPNDFEDRRPLVPEADDESEKSTECTMVRRTAEKDEQSNEDEWTNGIVAALEEDPLNDSEGRNLNELGISELAKKLTD